MILYTDDLNSLTETLSLADGDLIATGEPTRHMRMARAVARELSLLSYEEASEILDNDGEIIVQVTPRRTILRLAPGIREVPGDGLPTEEELMQIERDHAIAFYEDRARRLAEGIGPEGEKLSEDTGEVDADS